MVSMVQVGGWFACSARPSPSMERGEGGRSRSRSRSRSFATLFPISPGRAAARRRSAVVVRAETVNPEIRKTEEKVVDTVPVAELAKPVTAYCRCWRSGTFPLCDGSHVKHNKATGDNVGPLLLKK